MITFLRVRNDQSGAISVNRVVLTSAFFAGFIAVFILITSGLGSSAQTAETQVANADIIHNTTTDESAPPRYPTLEHYLVANGGNYEATLAAIIKDAPEGFEYAGIIDDATGVPVYNQGNTFCVAGKIMDDMEYIGGNSYTKYPLMGLD